MKSKTRHPPDDTARRKSAQRIATTLIIQIVSKFVVWIIAHHWL